MEIKPHGFVRQISLGAAIMLFLNGMLFAQKGDPSNRSAKSAGVAATIAVSERLSEDLVYSY